MTSSQPGHPLNQAIFSTRTSSQLQKTVSESQTLKRTPIYDRHVALGGKMVPFAGYDMPVQYSGIIDEHHAVRSHAGLFDVSHMGEVMVSGDSAFAFVQNLVSNDISTLYDGKALYTVMCKPDGGVVDDLLVYRISENDYLLVINASNIEGDIAWMRKNNAAGANLRDISDDIGLLALQGPSAFDILKSATGYDASDLKYYHFDAISDDSFLALGNVIVSRTGYTGEPGVEIYCNASDLPAVWDALMSVAEEYELKPVGLGARDTLRLESGFCLYGNELTTDTNPLEAGLGWITKLGKEHFVGKERLAEIKQSVPSRKLVGFVVDERGIPRSGYEILDKDDTVIGEVTSGTQSPVLGKGIGMGYVANKEQYTLEGSVLKIAAGRRMISATVKKAPFHK